jgi:hypothetical protein
LTEQTKEEIEDLQFLFRHQVQVSSVATGILRPPGSVKALPDFFSEQETDTALGFGYLWRSRGPIRLKPIKKPI